MLIIKTKKDSYYIIISFEHIILLCHQEIFRFDKLFHFF